MGTLLLIDLHGVLGGPPGSPQPPPAGTAPHPARGMFMKRLLWSRPCTKQALGAEPRTGQAWAPALPGGGSGGLGWSHHQSREDLLVRPELGRAGPASSLSFQFELRALPPHNSTSHLRLFFLPSAKGMGDHPACQPLAIPVSPSRASGSAGRLRPCRGAPARSKHLSSLADPSWRTHRTVS